MKNQAYAQAVSRDKVLVIVALYTVSALIFLFGAFLSIMSIEENFSIPVLSSQIPGAVFGVVISFLGIRYMLSVGKLKAEVYKSESKFSWSNFKKGKK